MGQQRDPRHPRARRVADGAEDRGRRRDQGGLADPLGAEGTQGLLVLDEPFDGLDVGARDEILGEVVRHVDASRAILLASHDLDEVERVADRLCVLERGRVIYEGALEDFRAARRRFAARVTGPVAWPDGVTEDIVEGQSIVVADGEESARMLLDGLIEGVDILEELPVRDLKEAFLLATSGTEEQR